jgi:hypothetical protein
MCFYKSKDMGKGPLWKRVGGGSLVFARYGNPSSSMVVLLTQCLGGWVKNLVSKAWLSPMTLNPKP